MKRLSADGSVGFAHVRVGHRQALKYNKKAPTLTRRGFFVGLEFNNILYKYRRKNVSPPVATDRLKDPIGSYSDGPVQAD